MSYLSGRELTAKLLVAVKALLASYAGTWGVRQIWYRLVSPPYQLLPQTMNSYKGLDARMVRWREQGEVPPGRISDRSTSPSGGEPGHDSVRGFLEDAMSCLDAENYTKNRWPNQAVVPIVYVEKDTITDTIERATGELGVVIYPTQGVASFTKLWRLARQRRVHVLYLTDHDATGVFMGDDFRERLSRYGGRSIPVTRIALTIDQVRRFNLPPNPTHPKDSRSPAYIEKFGDRAWELDALPPEELETIVRRELKKFIDPVRWEQTAEEERDERAELEPKLGPVQEALRAVLASYGGAGQ